MRSCAGDPQRDPVLWTNRRAHAHARPQRSSDSACVGALACDVLIPDAEDFMRKSLFATLLAVAALSSCKSSSNEPPAADNPARNASVRAAKTADNASNAAADRDVM